MYYISVAFAFICGVTQYSEGSILTLVVDLIIIGVS